MVWIGPAHYRHLGYDLILERGGGFWIVEFKNGHVGKYTDRWDAVKEIEREVKRNERDETM